MNIVKELSQNKAVESIIQFGSSLKSKERRDIDICILGKLTFAQKLALRSKLPAKYDLSFYDELPLHLKWIVLTTGKILFTINNLKILRELHYLERDYPRYAQFLEEHYQNKVGAL